MKKLFRFIFKSILGFIAFILLYFGAAFLLSRISVDPETPQESQVTMYVLSNGVHTDLVVPIKSSLIDWSQHISFANTLSRDTSFQYLAFGWGDKGFYLETPEWKDLKASVAFNAAFGLSTTAIHATYYKTMQEGEQCKKILIGQAQYQRHIDYIQKSLEKDASGKNKFIPTNAVYGKNDAFYEANGRYSMMHTCNTWANSGLKASGQKCCYWTPFDTGIFHHYK